MPEPTDLDETDAAVVDDLTARERVALTAWVAEAPPANFAERVVAARAAAAAAPVVVEAAPPPPRGRVLNRATVVVAGACAAAIGIALVRGGGAGAPQVRGEVEVAARRSIALGGRGVAVAEAGAALAWQVDAAGASITQRAGDVFYRVERGGPFVVHTPAGDVRVTGTCFRVEVAAATDQPKDDEMATTKTVVLGGAVGAALAAAVVVSVYEGGVVVAGPSGTRTAGAGERLVLGRGAAGGGAGGAPDDGAAGVAVASLGREQLLAQHAAQRAQIASLTAEVARLRADGGAAGAGPGGAGPRRGADDGDGRPWFDPSPELLAQMAKECHVRFDMPPMMESEPQPLPPRAADEFGLTPDELAGVNAALAEVHAAWSSKVRALYVEVTGDAAGADALSPSALAQEIQDKSPRDEADAIRRRIAQERAGLALPPADLTQASALERYLRALAALGGDVEAALARRIGAPRARELRAADQGLFGMRMEMAGCPDGDDATATR